MTVKSGELLPCPFCFVEPIVDGEHVVIDHKWTCHLRSETFLNNTGNVGRWNTRAPSTPKAVSSDALWINGMCCSGHPNCIHAPKSKNYTSTERIIEMIDELPKADDELALQLQAEIKAHSITKESLCWWIRECKRLKAGEVDREALIELMSEPWTNADVTKFDNQDYYRGVARLMLSAIESLFTLVPREDVK